MTESLLRIIIIDKKGFLINVLRNLEPFQNLMQQVEVNSNIINIWFNNMEDLNRVLNAVENTGGIKKINVLPTGWTDQLKRKYDEISDPFTSIIGESGAIKEAIYYAKLVAPKDTPVLLRGESGTGKEIFALAIHNASSRKGGPFIPVSCGNFPQELLESELFGYEKGAFTDASISGKIGLFEAADNGTLFLDEIAELDLHLQAKLLRVLQENKIRKVGGISEKKVNVRVICATNRNLERMVDDGEFRKDLYYRINIFPVYLPSLRDRDDDVKILADYFLAKTSIKFKKNIKGFTAQAYKKLFNYSWPGNVRELQNVIERTVILTQSRLVKPEDIEIRDFYEGFSDFGRKINHKSNTLKEMLEKVELDVIEEAYKKYGSARQVARALGVSHTKIINMLKLLKK